MTEHTGNESNACEQLVLVAINDESLWHKVSKQLEGRFRVRRETNGLRAFDVLMLLKPTAVIAETGLPGLSGILLARLIGHNRYLTQLPVALIFSREFLIEEFWAKESGAVAVVTRKNVDKAITALDHALLKARPINDEDWVAAEKAIQSQGGPAAAAAGELERQLIGASIMSRLGEIEVAGKQEEGDVGDTIPVFIGQAFQALASVLEFALVGIALFDTEQLYMVDNEVFSDILDHEAFLKETSSSLDLYASPEAPSHELKPVQLPPVRLELPGTRQPASTFFALPLTGRRGVYGLLSLMTYKQIAVREYYLHTLSLIGAQLAVNLERAIFYEEVRRLSITDPLTGLFNRRASITRLETEFRRAIRYNSPLSIAICDLDDFKKINDTFGHQTGDAVLKGTAMVFKNSVREIDLVGRWGGEELAVVFPETDLEGALTACERIRSQVEDAVYAYGGRKLKVTVSFGVATLNPEHVCPVSVDAMVSFADRAMYLAKSFGKNRVVDFMELPEMRNLINQKQ